jgi:DNA-directed RNA polymerase specialized sigma24 family protein
LNVTAGARSREDEVSALIDDTDHPVVLSSEAISEGELADRSTANGVAADGAGVVTPGSADNERHNPVSGDDAGGGESASAGSASVGSDSVEHESAVGESAASEDTAAVDGTADPGPDLGLVPSSGAQAQVVQDGPAPTRAELRVDFGAHLEANYRRLVAQLYAITLDPAEAHSAVQDAYSRAWRSWATVSRTPDPTGWVRRVAVRSTIRSRFRFRLRSRRPVGPGLDTSVGALLAALRRLHPPERRCVVLHHMAGVSLPEIAAVEGVSVGTTAARLSRAQHVVNAGLVDLLSDVLGPDDPNALNGWAVPEWDSPRPPAVGAADYEEDQP